MRYIIQSPPYNPCSGGVRQLHYLAALLHSINQSVAMTVPNFFCPFLPVIKLAETIGDIAVYPEIYPNNRLGAWRVVHYALGFLGNLYRKAGGTGIPNNELLMLGMASMRDKPGFLLAEAAHYYAGPLNHSNLCFLPCVSDGEWLYPETKTLKNLCYRGNKTCPDLPDLPDGGVTLVPPSDGSFSHRMRTLALLRRAENF